jgi:dihydropteroate synthase
VTLGCRIVRAHDVLGTRRVCDVIAAILEAAPDRDDIVTEMVPR